MAYDPSTGNSDEVAGDAVGGLAGAVPFMNMFAPGISQLISNDAQRGKERAAIHEIQGLKGPQFGNGQYRAGDYSGDFSPEAYRTPEAASYQTINVDPRTRDIAMSALGRLQGFADQAATSQEALGRANALNDANSLAGQREGAIAAAAQRRGQGGSGLEYVLRNQAAQEGAMRAQTGGLESAQQAALQRLMGTQASMQGAQSMRGQDIGLAAQNAAIINAFNMANTNARNAANSANTDLRNAAGMRNLDARQGYNNNVAGAGNANLSRSDQNAMATYGADERKRMAIANLLTGSANRGMQANQQAQAAGQQGFKNLGESMRMVSGGM